MAFEFEDDSLGVSHVAFSHLTTPQCAASPFIALALALVSTLSAPEQATGAQIESTFDVDEDGWSVTSGGSLSWEPAGCGPLELDLNAAGRVSSGCRVLAIFAPCQLQGGSQSERQEGALMGKTTLLLSAVTAVSLISLSGCSSDRDPVAPIPVDSCANKPSPALYWSSYHDGHIASFLEPAGETPQTIVDQIDSIGALARDTSGGKLYWSVTPEVSPGKYAGAIHRANEDGSDAELIVDSVGYVRGLSVDSVGQKIYWTDDTSSPNRLQRSNLDGTETETLVTYVENVDLRQIFVDSKSNKMYWTLGADRRIERANLDGSQHEVVLDDDTLFPVGIVIDSDSDTMYWSDYISDTIRSSRLDGSEIRDVVTDGLMEPWGLVLDESVEFLYWTDAEAGTISRVCLGDGRVRSVLGGLSKGIRSLQL